MAEQTKAIWVGTREDGIFKLSRKNGGWTQSEPSLKGKGLMCLVVDSSGDKLYAGFFQRWGLREHRRGQELAEKVRWAD
jgi:hypothetical protein